MSSLGVRKPVKTYSRLRKRIREDDEPATKRRRVNSEVDNEGEENNGRDALASAENLGKTLSAERKLPSPTTTPGAIEEPFTDPLPPTSSPRSSAGLFSDELPRSTPPSSPGAVPSSPPMRIRRPIFSLLKRRTVSAPSSTEPLSERSSNPQQPLKPRPKQQRLVQMQLDLVGGLRKTCRVCGMEYIPSNSEDAKLHQKFHAMNVGGVDFTKAFVERLKQKQVWSGGNGSFIAVVGRKDTMALRNKAVDVLKVVNTELAAVSIPEDELWGQTQMAEAENAATTGDTEHAKRSLTAGDRFKVYLFVRSNKCVGACLAERILEAYAVEDKENATPSSDNTPSTLDSSSITISTAADPALLGISRIWASNLHRKQGIATRLLDVARSDFLYGMTIAKEMVAFSQPTASGGQLARKWYGRRVGWHVYRD